MRWLAIVLIAVCGVTVWLALPDAAGGGSTRANASTAWLESYSNAQVQAKTSGRPMLVNFTGSDWCTWCQRLKEEVFTTQIFKEWADANVVLLEIDFPQAAFQSAEIQKQNDALMKKFNVEGFPTVLMLNADGTKIGEIGYQRGGPQAWIAALKTASKMK